MRGRAPDDRIHSLKLFGVKPPDFDSQLFLLLEGNVVVVFGGKIRGSLAACFFIVAELSTSLEQVADLFLDLVELVGFFWHIVNL